MPLLRINATADGLTLHQAPCLAKQRLSKMASMPGPAIIMVHGYKYAPETNRHCPHKKIFGQSEHAWPAQLGFNGHTPSEGLGIALGWYARGRLKTVHRRAEALGKEIAMIVAMLRAHRSDKAIHIVAHSLGSEAALNALQHLPCGAIDRIILMTGASYIRHALEMLDTPAGRSVELLNVTSRENDLFDAGFERLVRSKHPNDDAIGRGIAAPNVTNLQIDCHRSLLRLKEQSIEIGHPEKRICHWSAYKRQGVMAFYNTYLRNPDALAMDRLPSRTGAPRWSRLLPSPLVNFSRAGLPRRLLPQFPLAPPVRLSRQETNKT